MKARNLRLPESDCKQKIFLVERRSQCILIYGKINQISFIHTRSLLAPPASMLRSSSLNETYPRHGFLDPCMALCDGFRVYKQTNNWRQSHLVFFRSGRRKMNTTWDREWVPRRRSEWTETREESGEFPEQILAFYSLFIDIFVK